jgi:phospholipid/cholesterol/gamma-HCH transport system ATP-binding protein
MAHKRAFPSDPIKKCLRVIFGGWGMALPAVEFRNVELKFESQVVFKNLNFHIDIGEKFVVIGPSGQGKSSLLKLIGSIVEPTRGEVLIEGQNLLSMSPQEKDVNLKKMGMLFQKNALFDSLTCAENVAFPLREVSQISENEIQKKIDFFLNAVGIPHARDLFPDEISGGMQKRLGIARALALDPEIIMYDDPTAGLDPITSRMIIKLILDLQEQRKSTLVAITNDMSRAYQLADRMAMVVDGELIITGNKEQTLKHQDQRVQQFIWGKLKGPLTEVS